jgi:hypothetical protein
MAKNKVIIMNLLMAGTIVIMFLGLFFSAFSVINDISFRVIRSNIPGAIMGMLVFYLGLRYYFLVMKLKPEIYANSSGFSWSNFKRGKKKRALLKN